MGQNSSLWEKKNSITLPKKCISCVFLRGSLFNFVFRYGDDSLFSVLIFFFLSVLVLPRRRTGFPQPNLPLSMSSNHMITFLVHYWRLFLSFPSLQKRKTSTFIFNLESGAAACLPRSCFEDHMRGLPGLDSCLG